MASLVSPLRSPPVGVTQFRARRALALAAAMHDAAPSAARGGARPARPRVALLRPAKYPI